VSDTLQYRIEDLLGPEPRCDFLDPGELIDLAENRLPDARRRGFEQHARECPACFELIRDLETFMRLAARETPIASERRAFRAADPGVRQQVGLASARAPRRPLWIGLLAASAAVLLILVLPRDLRQPLIDEAGTVPFVPPPAVRGAAHPETWEEARRAWEAGDMARVVAVLTPPLEKDTDDPNLLFYVGVAHLAQDEFEGAVSRLEHLDHLQADAPSPHTRWFLAAALDGAGRRDTACAMLRSISSMGATRAGAARRIVERSCP